MTTFPPVDRDKGNPQSISERSLRETYLLPQGSYSLGRKLVHIVSITCDISPVNKYFQIFEGVRQLSLYNGM